MRILVANKFWYRRAGLERVMFDEIAWLAAEGHEIAHFSTRHPENDASPWENYFVPYFELGIQTQISRREQAIAAQRLFWNQEAEASFSRLLRDFRPDVVHVHGIHRQLSPSILAAAQRAHVPVVQTLHDYHPICPADDLLFAGSRACDPPRCTRFNVSPCARFRCVQHSASKSSLAAAELLWRRWVLHYERLVDAFISPSRYLADVVTSHGVNKPIHLLPNAIPDPGTALVGNTASDEFVYAGRLSREKGLPTLLRAVELAGVRLAVAGDGPLRASLEAAAPSTVRFLGRLDGDDVNRLLATSRAAVVPSEWAENAPMAVLEPMVLGRPVIATRMGGIPEQVRDGVDGVIIPHGNPVELAAALRVLAEDPALADRLGRSARERAITRFDPGVHTRDLVDIYRGVVAQRNRNVRRA